MFGVEFRESNLKGLPLNEKLPRIRRSPIIYGLSNVERLNKLLHRFLLPRCFIHRDSFMGFPIIMKLLALEA